MTFCSLGRISASFDFLVGLPEEPRIGEPRAQHAFVPGTHQPLGILGQIDHRKEMRRQFPAPLLHGEILLVAAHHGDQDLVGQFEERRIEVTLDHGWVFVEVGDQFQQVSVVVDVIAGALRMSRLARG